MLLMSDLHVPADPATQILGTLPYRLCEEAFAAIASLRSAPDATIVTGDCAVTDGQAGDYAALSQLTAPLSGPMHFVMGNHDNRERFWQAVPSARLSQTAGSQAGMIALQHANWFLLDSLRHTNEMRGAIGADQTAWLLASLDATPSKPAIVAMHHNIDTGPSSIGLDGADELLEQLRVRRNVKAVFFGHTHNWNIAQHAGIHLITLPPVAYTFSPHRPRGFVTAKLDSHGAQLTLHALPTDHAQHMETTRLVWR